MLIYCLQAENLIDPQTQVDFKAIGELKNLVQVIKDHTSNGGNVVQLVIYFDKAHLLFKAGMKSQRPLFFILLSVLNEYCLHPLFAIFLLTVSHIGHLAPSQSKFTSAHAIATETHQPPITELPFDCAPPGYLPVKPYTLAVEDITKIPFMAWFGRPM